MKQIQINGYKRVTKKAALRAYKNGETVYLCPVKLAPGSPWHPETPLNRKQRETFVIDEIGLVNDFNNYIGSFEYYNCDAGRGRYTAFYKRSFEK